MIPCSFYRHGSRERERPRAWCLDSVSAAEPSDLQARLFSQWICSRAAGWIRAPDRRGELVVAFTVGLGERV